VLLGTGQFFTRRAPWLYPAMVMTIANENAKAHPVEE
jgi:hypothetical protein